MDNILSAYVIPGVQRTGKKTEWSLPVLDALVKTLSECYKIHPDRFMSSSRKREYVYIRNLLCYYVKKKFPHISLEQIGEAIGGKDHTTVIHARKTYKDWLDTDSLLPSALQTVNKHCTKQDYYLTAKILDDAIRNLG